jgi:hypothetical protein
VKKLILLLLLPLSVFGQMTYTQSSTTYSYESTTGTALTLGDDQTISNIPIGFTFNYWGTNFTTVNICSNGWISFTNTGGNIVGGSPNNVVANGIHANAMDLFPITNYFVRYQTIGSSPNRKFVVSYHIGYYDCRSNSTLFTDFQIVLSETTNLIQINVNLHLGCLARPSLQGVSNSNNSLIVTTPSRNGVNWSPTTNSSVIFTPYTPFTHSGIIRTENNIPVENILVKLFKRGQTTGLWTQQTTSTTNSLGQYSFSQPVSNGDQWYIEVVIPTTTSNLSSADFVGIDDIVLQRVPIKSIHYHKYEVSGDNLITINDIYTISKRINGLNYTKRTLLFTESQWDSLNAGSADLRTSIPGVQNTYTFTPSSGGITNLYILSPGFTNQSNLNY